MFLCIFKTCEIQVFLPPFKSFAGKVSRVECIELKGEDISMLLFFFLVSFSSFIYTTESFYFRVVWCRANVCSSPTSVLGHSLFRFHLPSRSLPLNSTYAPPENLEKPRQLADKYSSKIWYTDQGESQTINNCSVQKLQTTGGGLCLISCLWECRLSFWLITTSTYCTVTGCVLQKVAEKDKDLECGALMIYNDFLYF